MYIRNTKSLPDTRVGETDVHHKKKVQCVLVAFFKFQI